MFGRKAKPCMVFEYGCLNLVSGLDEMIEEMFRKNRYWNKLVEIDHKYNLKAKSVLTVPEDPIAEIKAKIEALRYEIKNRRKKRRSGKVDCSDLQERINELKKQLLAIKPIIKEERKKS